MDEKKLKALTAELAKGLKTEADLNQFSRMLTKFTIETAFNASWLTNPGMRKIRPKQAQTPVMATRQNGIVRWRRDKTEHAEWLWKHLRAPAD